MEPAPVSDDLIGAVLASRYRIEAELARGAMAVVYRASDVQLGRSYAVKLLHRHLLGEDQTDQRFDREAEIASALCHPNVVSVVDAGTTADGRRYLVMDYIAGHTLFELICDAAPLPPARVIAIAQELCDGLQHAHERGLIHRDFKPENVIVESGEHGDVPRILDFGVAIPRLSDAVDAKRITSEGLVLGTPHYMAPEYATGVGIDHRIDLFALGVICFEMLTGKAPFDGDGVDVARANLHADTPAMSARVPGLEVDPLLEAFTRRLLRKSPDRRPQSAAAARELLDLIQRDRKAAAFALTDVPPPLTRPIARAVPLPRPG